VATNAAHRHARFNTIGLLACTIAAAWAACAWAELSGVAAHLHHHALYESGRPYWFAAVIVLAAWQVMTAAMMLPSSLGFIRHYASIAARAPGFPAALTLFLASYFAVWTAFALAAFASDMQLHRIVDAWPWLGAHATIVPAVTLGLAAVYQFTPLKDACLRACRHPGVYLVHHYRRGALNGLRLGFGHALFCLGCCWALMLLMFAAGVAHLAWMGALAAIMFVEKATPAGNRIVAPVGAALGVAGIIALIDPGIIPGL
jgi:predicted metal-binding membrane protein